MLSLLRGDNMVTLTKPINKMSIISNRDSKSFIQDFNNNKVNNEFLNSCKKAGKLFKKAMKSY